MSTNKITCSFTVDRDIYNAYKSIVEELKKNPNKKAYASFRELLEDITNE